MLGTCFNSQILMCILGGLKYAHALSQLLLGLLWRVNYLEKEGLIISVKSYRHVRISVVMKLLKQ
jgi:hypothetical protein